MPTFDPNNPQNGQTADADFLRDQFNALKGLIDAEPPGQVGPAGQKGNDGATGPQGPAGTDGVSISNVADDGSGRAIVQLSNGANYGPFSIASGPQGQPGATGAQGPQGYNGSDGAPGPQGNNGNDGAPGPQGPQGNPGEVTAAQLNDALNTALAGTSANSNGVAPLSLALSDPPTENDVSQILDKLNELIAALRR